MPVTLQSSNQTLTKKGYVLMLCKSGSLGTFIHGHSSFLDTNHFEEISDSFKAFEWLKYIDKNDPGALRAIIADRSLLEEDNYEILKDIKKKPTLRAVPFIVISKTEPIPLKQAHALGIDDCYKSPVHWDNVRKRVDWLAVHKLQINKRDLEKDIEDEGSYTFQMPWTKRAFDIVASGLGLLALSPLFAVTALAIWFEDRGPVFYSSKRMGTGSQSFKFWKFRSMFQNADQKLAELKKSNNQYEAGDDMFVKIKNDPRITKTGRIIRKFSIDELPQLYNVFIGEMSMVGNRPLPEYEGELLTNDEMGRRFWAPAGITGLWQVTKRGKNNMSSKERVDLDITYSKNYSFWYDMKLLIRTATAFVQHEDV